MNEAIELPLHGLNDLYTPYRLTDSPWQAAHRRGWFTPLALHNHTYRRHRPFHESTRELGWLTLSGKSITGELDKILPLELQTYATLTAAAFECGHRQFDWALEALTLSGDALQVHLDNRPASAAELLRDSSIILLGLTRPMSLIANEGRFGPLHTVFKVPVSPDPEIESKPFIISVDEALTLEGSARRLDDLADRLQDGFEQIELKSRRLTSQLRRVDKSLAKANDYLNPDLLFAANTELAVAMFYRATALADFMRKMIFQNIV